MVRLTVKEIYELAEDIQRTGEVNATVMTRDAFVAGNLFVAWARSAEGEEFYLAVWQNNDSWLKAKQSNGLQRSDAHHRYIMQQIMERPELPSEVVEDG